ncbi:DNA double-strand break repair nuclease NurA [[Eubacterium] cellulosolvens]
MSLEVIDEIILSLAKEIGKNEIGKPYFKTPPYQIFQITKNDFKSINEVDSKRKIAFIDGGNREIIGSPDFSIQINRIYFNAFQNNEKMIDISFPSKIEFFSVTYAQTQNEDIFYHTRLYPLTQNLEIELPDENDLNFNSADRTMSFGGQIADISRVAIMSRVFTEWNCAKFITEKILELDDIIVMDGNLRTWYTNENKYANNLFEIAKEKGVLITGLSKTSRLMTTNSQSLLGNLERYSRSNLSDKEWYIPIAQISRDDHNAIIFIMKLNRNSNHVFRFEIMHDQYIKLRENEINEIFSQISKNSRDLTFPGYPYGLIDADHYARISEEEAKGYKVMFLSQIAKNNKEDSYASIHAVDAHDILNELVA